MNPADEQMSDNISSTDNLREELDRVERKLKEMIDYVNKNPHEADDLYDEYKIFKRRQADLSALILPMHATDKISNLNAMEEEKEVVTNAETQVDITVNTNDGMLTVPPEHDGTPAVPLDHDDTTTSPTERDEDMQNGSKILRTVQKKQSNVQNESKITMKLQRKQPPTRAKFNCDDTGNHIPRINPERGKCDDGVCSPTRTVNRQTVNNGIRPNGDLIGGEAIDIPVDTPLGGEEGVTIKHTTDVENVQNTIATAGDEVVVENTQSATTIANGDTTDGDESDGIYRSPFLDCMNAMLGQMVEVQHLNGNTTKGVFHALSSLKSPEYQIVLKVPKIPEATWSGYSVVTIPNSDIIQVKATEVNATEINLLQDLIPSAGVATEMRKNGFNSMERDLTKVDECWLDPQHKHDTDDKVSDETWTAGWNQFRVFTEMTGQTIPEYNKDLYTTKLDKSKISKEHEESAERIAGEIRQDNTYAGNVHADQERNHRIDPDFSEEDLFSGVMRPTTNEEMPDTNEEGIGNHEGQLRSDEILDSTVDNDGTMDKAVEKANEADNTNVIPTTTIAGKCLLSAMSERPEKQPKNITETSLVLETGNELKDMVSTILERLMDGELQFVDTIDDRLLTELMQPALHMSTEKYAVNIYEKNTRDLNLQKIFDIDNLGEPFDTDMTFHKHTTNLFDNEKIEADTTKFDKKGEESTFAQIEYAKPTDTKIVQMANMKSVSDIEAKMMSDVDKENTKQRSLTHDEADRTSKVEAKVMSESEVDAETMSEVVMSLKLSWNQS